VKLLPRGPCGRFTAIGLARRQPGFTLVEVLVALAIVAVALAAGMRASSTLSDNALRLSRMTAAQWCADNTLVGLKLRGGAPSVGDSDFACTQLGLEYKGKLSVRPTPNPNFRRVDASIADERDLPLLTLSTVLSTR
jgi:general secretion pathway protein I